MHYIRVNCVGWNHDHDLFDLARLEDERRESFSSSKTGAMENGGSKDFFQMSKRLTARKAFQKKFRKGCRFSGKGLIMRSMSSKSGGNDKIFSVVLGLVILGFFFLYLKRSGQLDEIVTTFRVLSNHAPIE